jgi:hypothetical protein
VPFLCQTLGKLVGVAGFEPATPSSRTIYTSPKLLKLLTSKWRKSVNKAGNDKNICAENVPQQFTYFVSDGTAVKIGSALDVDARIKGLQTGHHAALEILAVLSHSDMPEMAAHERFAHLRIRGEWFSAGPDLVAFINGHREAAKQRAWVDPLTEARKAILAWGRKQSHGGIRNRARTIAGCLERISAGDTKPQSLADLDRHVTELAAFRADPTMYERKPSVERDMEAVR